jgi:uncharacterized protein YxjI
MGKMQNSEDFKKWAKKGDDIFMSNFQPLSFFKSAMGTEDTQNMNKKHTPTTTDIGAKHNYAESNAGSVFPKLTYNQDRTFNLQKKTFMMSPGADIDIFDEQGAKAFRVERNFSLHSNTDLTIVDAETGATLCRIAHDLLGMQRRYRVFYRELEVASCLKSIHNHYTYDRYDYLETLNIYCSFMDISLVVKRDQNITAIVKENTTFGSSDRVMVKVGAGENVLHYICIMIIMQREREYRRNEDL